MIFPILKLNTIDFWVIKNVNVGMYSHTFTIKKRTTEAPKTKFDFLQ